MRTRTPLKLRAILSCIANLHTPFLKTIFIVILFCLPQMHWAQYVIQDSWNFGGSNSEEPYDLIPLSDGGILMVGESWSSDVDVPSNAGSSDGYVIKVNPDGTIAWSRTAGGSGLDHFYSAVEAADGSIFCIGAARSYGGSVVIYDYWVVKYDANGTLQWNQIYEGSSNDYAYAALEMADGNILIGGYTTSTGPMPGQSPDPGDNTNRIWTLVIDTDGNVVTSETYGGSNAEQFSSLHATSDGGYIIGGITSSFNPSGCAGFTSFSYWALKLDADLNEEWNRTYGGTQNQNLKDVIETTDGGYVLTGYHTSGATSCDVPSNIGSSDIWTVKTDAAGNIIWSRMHGGSASDSGYKVVEIGDEGYLVSARSSSTDNSISNYGGEDVLLLMLDKSTGDIIWQNNYGGSQWEGGSGNIEEWNTIKLFDNGELWLASQSSSDDIDVPGNNGFSGKDFWLAGFGEVVTPACSYTDSLALVAIYNAMNGASWTNTWDLSMPMSGWFGVTLSGEGCVTHLDLTGNQVAGPLSPELANLDSLENLDFSFNQLTGSIPTSLENLSNLSLLHLKNNELSGAIPPELGNINTLTSIDFTDNLFTGSFPIEVTNLTNLIVLDLSFNMLSGNIPIEIGNLSNLTALGLTNNQFSGTIPAELGNLNNLEFCFLQNNQLSGCFDPNIFNLCPVFFKDFTNNPLLPWQGDFDEYCLTGGTEPEQYGAPCDDGNVTTSNDIIQNDCSCAGSLPNNCIENDSLILVDLYNTTDGPNWTNTWNLNLPMSTWYGVSVNGDGCVTCLDLDGTDDCTTSGDTGNGLSGPIPASLGGLANLEDLLLSDNNLGPSIPVEIGNLSLLRVLELDFNALTDTVPKELGRLSELRYLELDDNLMTGSLSDSLGNLTNLVGLFIFNNEFSGELPASLSNLVNLTAFTVFNNNFTGTLPDLTNMPNLEECRAEDNQLTGLPDLSSITSWGNQSYEGLKVENNQLTFEDILPNMPVFDTYPNGSYSPQDSFFTSTTYNHVIGDDLNIDLVIDAGVGDNDYTWFKDGTQDVVLNTNTRDFTNLQIADAGTYWVHVTNPAAPDLTLESQPFTINVTSVCQTNDSLALVDFYNSNDGANWVDPWILSDPMNSWNGVSVDANGCVTDLNLFNQNISGSLPDLNLPNLVILRIQNNNLSGAIPNFSFLTSIELLQLSQNAFTSITGFDNVPTLIELNVSVNQIGGDLSDYNFNLPLLQEIFFSDNLIGGTVPDFSGMPSLLQLHFHTNQVTGTLPNFTNLPLLIDITIYNNQLSAANYPSQFAADGNSFMTLFFQNNAFTFDDILPYVNDLNYQGGLNLNYEPQDSIFTPTTYNVVQGTDLNIDLLIDAGILDNDYTWFKDGIQDVVINTNTRDFINIQIADAGTYWVHVTNPGAPDLTLESHEIIINVTSTCVENDSLALVALYNATDGANWTNTWNLNLPMNTWYGVTVNGDGCVTCLDLDGIDDCVTQISSGNNLIGTIPIELGSISDMTVLSLANNQLTGSIPAELGNLANLTNLYLHSNQLSGNIPPALGNLSNLTRIDLYFNQLSGNIPTELGMLSNLVNLFSGFNQLTGSIPIELGNLSNLSGLFLDNNLLTGSIPAELGSLSNLTQLSLHSNQLSGSIPATLGNLTNLTDLTLNDNNLSTCYDPNLFNLCSVGNRDLSNNPLLPWQGDFDIYCATSGTEAEQYGATCDDGNVITVSDVIQADCSCAGVIVNACVQSDSLILVDLYNTTDGINWTNTWDLGMPMSTWYGVTLNGDGCVTCLDLDGTDDCSTSGDTGNGLSGPIPASLGGLTNLENLLLSDNNLGPSIPVELGNLSLLRVLELDFNALTDTVPKELGRLSELRYLELDDNLMTGSLSDSLGNLTNLIGLYIFNNEFSGELPASLSNLTNLTAFTVFNNNFTGSLPDLTNMTNLVECRAEDNQLTDLPDLSSISSWGGASYQGLKVEINQLTFEDILPNMPIFTTFPNGSYSPQDSIFTPTTYNLIEGDNLNIDLLIDAGILDNDYTWFKDGIQDVVINTNTRDFINIQIADAGTYWVHVTNPGAPDLTLESHEIIINVTSTCVENDSLALIALYNATDGANWTNTWNLNMPMNTWYGVTLNGDGCVTCLDLDGINDCFISTGPVGNNLIGTIPTELGNLSNLTFLSLTSNQLSGSIPTSLGNLNNLVTLSISLTQISGSIPVEIGNLGSLTTLTLLSNQLSGSIPSELSTLSNLATLQLSGNQLSGGIPTILDNISNLQFLDASNNQITGSIPLTLGNLINLTTLSLHSNQLSGSIPAELGNLTNLTDLTLNDNNLSTCYDPNLFNLCSVGNRDFSNNPLLPWEGNFDLYCLTGGTEAEQYGATCDDGNALTITDIIQNDCSCAGVLANPCAVNDSLILVDFYISNNGASWVDPWILADPISTWSGVTLNGNGCVTELNLFNKTIAGSLPNLNLPNLIILRIQNNNLTGAIPSFSFLTSVELLQLGQNDFNSIAGLGSLPSLIELNLSQNNIGGNLSDYNFALPALEEIFFSDNEIGGTVPDFDGMPNLVKLHFHTNQVTGTVPNFTNLPALEEISIFSNNLDVANYPTQVINDANAFDLIQLDSNAFTFDDLLPYINDINFQTVFSLSYSPQDSIFTPTTYNLTEGDDLNIDLLIDPGVGDNVYTWYKDNVFDLQLNANTRDFTNIQIADAGTYWVHVTNPGAPDLTLESHEIIINIGPNCDALLPLLFEYPDSCEGSTLSLTGTDWQNFQWSTGDMTPSTILDTDGEYAVTVTHSNACVVSDTVDIDVVESIPTTNLSGTYCDGGSYTYEGGNYTAGTYPFMLVSQDGCDSMIQLVVMELFNSTNTITSNLCEGESILVNNITYDIDNQSGTETISAGAANGCDSIININLTFDLITMNDFATAICNGQSVMVGTSTYTATGNYTDTLFNANSNGCDSIVLLDLVVYPNVPLAITDTTICEGEDIVIEGMTFSTAGSYNINIPNSIGCDSINIDLELTVTPIYDLTIDETICEGDSYQLGSTSYNTTGTYTETLSNMNGCDSVVTLNLSVADENTFGAAFVGDDMIICDSFLTLLGNLPSGISGYWTGPAYAEFSDTEIANPFVESLQVGVNTFTWNLYTDDCPDYSSASINITLDSGEPIANADYYELVIDETLENFNPLQNDDLSQLSDWDLNIITNTSNGTLTQNSDSLFSYTPVNNFTGRDSFVYEICNTNCMDHCSETVVILEVDSYLNDVTDVTIIITPNDDGKNDFLVFDDITEYPDRELYISNRWGTLVYSSTPYENQWYGQNRNGKKLPEGTYYFIIYLDIGDGEIIRGSVTIQRD